MKELTTEDVRAALAAHGLNDVIRTFSESTATSEEAAAAIGTPLGTIVKSLCFMVDGQPVVVLAAGDHRVDSKKLAELSGVAKKRVKIASAEETLTATGYLPGGVPPVGHSQPVPILIDDTLSRYENVYAAAGSPNAIFPITLEKLIEITGGRMADLALT